jgi:hypothetical protein
MKTKKYFAKILVVFVLLIFTTFLSENFFHQTFAANFSIFGINFNRDDLEEVENINTDLDEDINIDLDTGTNENNSVNLNTNNSNVGIGISGSGLNIETDDFNLNIGNSGVPGCGRANCMTIPSQGTFDGISGEGSFRQTILNWLNFFLGFLGLISMSMIVYSGFLYVTAMGNQEQSEKAKKLIIWVTVGVIVIILAWVLVNELLGIVE